MNTGSLSHQLSEKEIQTLIKLGMGEKIEHDLSETLVSLFRKQATKTPENVAVVFKDRQMRYRELDELTDRLAAHLISTYHVQPEEAVGVMIDRSELMAVYPLSIMKAGATYMPLDFNFPEERLLCMCEDAEVRLILSEDDRVHQAMPSFNGDVFTSDCLEELPKCSCQLPEPLPTHRFVILFTSGSTGKPKGVVLEHHNIVNLCHWYIKEVSITQEDRLLGFANFAFDMHMTDIYPALFTGASVCILDNSMRTDLEAMNHYMEKRGITIAFLTTQVGHLFATTIKNTSLRLLLVAGEKLPALKKPSYTVMNAYGPPETHISTFYNITQDYESAIIGKPIDNHQLFVVDRDMNLLPQGIVGELLIAGEGLSRGYLHPVEKDAARFLTFMGKRCYRTGDLVRWNEQGELEYLGRIDTQVKLRGFRIELGEIENQTLKYNGIKQAVANVSDGQLLCLYYTADCGIDEGALKDFLAKSLPDYMLPAAYIHLDKLPLTPNGKVDRKRLPAPELTSEIQYVAPTDELEAELSRGFAAALGFDRVGAQSGFFDMGGDSISVMRLITECPSLCLSFKLIFEGRTPAGIATLIRQRERTARGMECKEGEGNLKGHFFGPLQRQYYEWGNEIFEGYGVHCDATIHLGKETDPIRLAQAVACVIKAHPALDARLMETEDGTLRWFCEEDGLKDYAISPEYVTRSAYSEIQGKLRKSMNHPGERMFNIRIFVITEEDGTESCDLYFDFLHPIADRVTIDIFLEDVNAAYEGREVEKETFSVLDYYDQIEKEVSTDRYCSEIEWNRHFAASFTDKICELEGDLSCGDENETLYIFEKLDIAPEIVENYAAACKVTVGSLLSAAYGLMQASYNGEHSAVTLTIYNGRDDARYARIMGAIYRHLPLCVRYDDDMTACDFVRATQENILKCRAHLLYEPDPVPMITAFSYQGEDLPEPFPFCSGLASYEETEDYEEEIFDFFVRKRQNGFYVELTYNTLAYSKTFIDRFIKDYTMVLRSLTTGVRPADIRISNCAFDKSSQQKG